MFKQLSNATLGQSEPDSYYCCGSAPCDCVAQKRRSRVGTRFRGVRGDFFSDSRAIAMPPQNMVGIATINSIKSRVVII